MKKFIDDFLASNELEAFITGPAGSGKTTVLKEITNHLLSNEVNFIVTAFTHKAKQVLQSKLDSNIEIKTLHSWLKKRPTINRNAKNIKVIMTNKQYGRPDFLRLLIVDEFSFVSEKDYFSIGELQDELELMDLPEFKEGRLRPLKVLYVGDLNQLSPVKGYSAIEPYGKFWKKLTKVHRTDNDLINPLTTLVNIIEGKEKLRYLEPTDNFIRKADIIKEYKASKEQDKIILAFTNKAVQNINADIKGRTIPKSGDTIYNSTFKRFFTIEKITKTSKEAHTFLGTINEDTEYNPLKQLNNDKNVQFYHTVEGLIIPAIFGSYSNKVLREDIANKLVNANRKNDESLSHKYFRIYKCLNDYVSNIDFEYCITVHKSQGSEFNEVFIDSKDFSNCINRKEMLKLLYVAISRAKNRAYLNT
ncbi:ATP-dependent helicase [Campylobacter jejuni]|nr:ATP-dependent helicase [Campylobacter jejuni]